MRGHLVAVWMSFSRVCCRTPCRPTVTLPCRCHRCPGGSRAGRRVRLPPPWSGRPSGSSAKWRHTIELYSRRPFEQVSVEDIAGAADVSRALFYRYFSGPADLFGAASRVAIDDLIARLRAPREGTPEEQLRSGVALLDKNAFVTWMSGQLVAMLTATGQYYSPS